LQLGIGAHLDLPPEPQSVGTVFFRDLQNLLVSLVSLLMDRDYGTELKLQTDMISFDRGLKQWLRSSQSCTHGNAV